MSQAPTRFSKVREEMLFIIVYYNTAPIIITIVAHLFTPHIKYRVLIDTNGVFRFDPREITPSPVRPPAGDLASLRLFDVRFQYTYTEM